MSLQPRPKRSLRAAVAAVEFAVILPPIVLLIIGSLDVARIFSLQHKLQEASMYGCRIYALGDMTQQRAIDAIDLSMAEKGLTGYKISFDPPHKSEIKDDLVPVTVTVQMPYSGMGFGMQSFLGGSDIVAKSVLPADLIGLTNTVGDGSGSSGGSGSKTPPPPKKPKKPKKERKPKKPKKEK